MELNKMLCSRLPLLPLLLLVVSCKESPHAPKSPPEPLATKTVTGQGEKPLSKQFKEYWYSGEAEITSYTLTQARYGELRDGHSVLVYVTEPFSAAEQVKADNPDSSAVPVLKLNTTKNFLTGIYPYSIMSSSFHPVQGEGHALKVSNSVQEWCGHVYAQLNNREQFEIRSHSYFESEGDRNFQLEPAHLEDEIWNKIRIDTASLPTGTIKMIPSLEYTRLSHKELKGYEAMATLTTTDSISVYTVIYPQLERSLAIHFTTDFPHGIERWTESYPSGFGTKAKVLFSTAVKKKRIKTPYWQQNGNSDLFLRDSLGL
ncbi:MAG: septum formation inhibitor Maf [Sediminicola sp.]